MARDQVRGPSRVVRGPLFFNIFINDLFPEVKES